LLSLQSEHVGEYGTSPLLTQRPYTPIRGFEYVCLLFFLSSAQKNHAILIKNGTLTYCLRIVQQCVVHMKTLKKGLVRAATAARESQAKERERGNETSDLSNVSKSSDASVKSGSPPLGSDGASLRVLPSLGMSGGRMSLSAINHNYADPLAMSNISSSASPSNSVSANANVRSMQHHEAFPSKPMNHYTPPHYASQRHTIQSTPSSPSSSNQFQSQPKLQQQQQQQPTPQYSLARDAEALLRWCLGCWDHFSHLVGLCLGIILNCVKLTVPLHVPLAVRACDLINALALCWPEHSVVDGLGCMDATSLPPSSGPSSMQNGAVVTSQGNSNTNAANSPRGKSQADWMKAKTMLVQRGLLSSIRGMLLLFYLCLWYLHSFFFFVIFLICRHSSSCGPGLLGRLCATD
jgi:hypothetical protein